MGLLPIIFTALTIFTICIVAIFSISYIIYRLKGQNKRKVSESYEVQMPIAQAPVVEYLPYQPENYEPVYEMMPEYNEPVYLTEQPYIKSAPILRNIQRYEVLNGYKKTPSSINHNRNIHNSPIRPKQYDVYNNYSDYNSHELKAVRIQR